MSLENSINDLNTSIQALIALMSAQSAPVTKPKAVKAAKPAAVKQAEPTTPVATVEAATEDNFPTLEEVINEMRVIEDREILTKIMNSFKVTSQKTNARPLLKPFSWSFRRGQHEPAKVSRNP
jgi:hypothetical protein